MTIKIKIKKQLIVTFVGSIVFAHQVVLPEL